MEATRESVCPRCRHLIISGQEIDVVERTGNWAHRECDPWDLTCKEQRDQVAAEVESLRAAEARVRELCTAVHENPDGDGRVWAQAVIEALDGET